LAFGVGEGEGVAGDFDGGVELFRAGGAGEGTGHEGMGEHPVEGEFDEGLAAGVCDRLELADGGDPFLGEACHLKGAFGFSGTRIAGQFAAEIFLGENPLFERAVGHGAEAVAFRCGGDAALEAVAGEHGIFHLVDKQGDAGGFEECCGLFAGIGSEITDAGVEHFALANEIGEAGHGFFDWGVGVVAVGIEDVEILDAEGAQGAVDAGAERFAAGAESMGSGPCVVAAFGGDDQFIAEGVEVGFQQVGKERFAVIVAEIHGGDAEIEGAENDGAPACGIVVWGEVIPKAEGDGGELEAVFSGGVRGGLLMAIVGGFVGHNGDGMETVIDLGQPMSGSG